jgi:predicted nucleic acid-binding protein
VILVDTSVWIEIIRGTLHVTSTEYLDFATCGPVLQEVFQGLDDSPERDRFRESLMAIPCLGDPLSLDVFLEAAEIYRQGRRKGYTIRSSTDCMIAAVAIQHDVAVWHWDRDFEYISRFTTLKTMRAPSVH